ncbi:aminofutalosine synthase MqnE [Kyrpidia spormannii]|uniref:Aminodeoxyfutalosine synthase n=1 Tax=Kyrpidia spormannii TaxID=2055160 RepID=A0A2K8N6Q3_9BACL|nr:MULTISPECIES: aminofutalosine synthase MqnE [Kyrpidia]ATY85041.1 aminofutalosine synthase MqnE [Kyrpidia spormannii]MCL6574780.1 aminofutalosine synthase MqnE [Kyrpidia sp.]CAB3393480.1 Aminodeoxyfutalosine synthase [Kyrpidia spormannii]HHY66753.1 aminofutalosine synthase MqnE [Alicyclobacillus sp.]
MSGIADIAEKVRHGQRLSLEDGLRLYRHDDLLEIGRLADEYNRRLNERNVYFIQNMYINPTNVCEAHCGFCYYRRDPDQEGAYTMSPDEVLEYVKERWTPGIKEFHIVGGHNPTVPFQYYTDVVRALKTAYPDVTIKAYTAAEVEFFHRLSGLSVKEVLQALKDAGLESMPGGGAEILSERYREKLAPDKASVEQWLDVHRIAHQLGIRTHATMLYGLIETLEERLQHMIYIRELQDETGGFLSFIPLAVQPSRKTASLKQRTSADDDLRTIAVSRLMLDNVPHIKAYWINIGPRLTQMAVYFGSSDIHGTLVEERISHAGGALTSQSLTRDELVWLIKGAGRIPVERDTFYRPVRVY